MSTATALILFGYMHLVAALAAPFNRYVEWRFVRWLLPELGAQSDSIRRRKCAEGAVSLSTVSIRRWGLLFELFVLAAAVSLALGDWPRTVWVILLISVVPVVPLVHIASDLIPIWLARETVARKARELLRKQGIPVCLECGYDLRGLTESRCPECGTAYEELAADEDGEATQG